MKETNKAQECIPLFIFLLHNYMVQALLEYLVSQNLFFNSSTRRYPIHLCGINSESKPINPFLIKLKKENTDGWQTSFWCELHEDFISIIIEMQPTHSTISFMWHFRALSWWCLHERARYRCADCPKYWPFTHIKSKMESASEYWDRQCCKSARMDSMGLHAPRHPSPGRPWRLGRPLVHL